MKREIRKVITRDGQKFLQVTSDEERFYGRMVSADGTAENRTWEFVPSVKWQASYCPKDRLISYIGRVGNEAAREAKEAGGEKGSKVHQAVSALLGGARLNFFENLFEAREGRMEPLTGKECEAVLSFVDWFDKTKPEVIAFDFPVWSAKWGYAGMVDLYCRIKT